MCRFTVWHIFVIIVINNKVFVVSQKCTAFDNVLVQLRDKTDYEYNKTVNGCIERIEFEGRTITEAYIRNQKIPILWPDSVRNMILLSTVSFAGCDLSEIKQGAFRNVPSLKNVQMSYCKIKEVPKGVFNSVTNLEILRIDNNEINFIENQAFANLTELKKVYGSNNKLEDWNTEWFKNSTALEIVEFKRNKIRSIPRRAFVSFRKLRQVYLDFNEITNIQTEAFKGIQKLEYLGLRNNRLTEIREDIFPNQIKIGFLTINANYFNFLPNELMKRMSVKDITIDYNPWNCPCLDRLYFWIYTNNGTIKTENNCSASNAPVCAYSRPYSQACLENADSELTKRYIGLLKNLKKPLDGNCARLD